MHDVAAYLVRRDHRLASDIRDLLRAELSADSKGEADAAWAGLDGALDLGEAPRARRLRQLTVALDAALVDWMDESRGRGSATTVSSDHVSADTANAATDGAGPDASRRRASLDAR